LPKTSETASAKINLYLHILGRRDDGYHDMQSLVVFADCGDRVEITGQASDWALAIDGPFAEGLSETADADNLVLRAARRLARQIGTAPPLALRLTKNLPVAAGIGGGSADAAAAIRLLSRNWGGDPGPPGGWADLGADVPVCLLDRPCLVEGMGERLTPVEDVPDLPAVLVNPGVPSSTGAVFAALGSRFGRPAAQPLPLPGARSVRDIASWLASQRNDLTRPAMEATPPIGAALAALAGAPDVLLARMSGSGATCFGLFPDQAAARTAAHWLRQRVPHCWVQETVLRGSPATG
jgi:4-diphosphocytidyl-2-C-methyl-D-erythritol kinase